MDGGFFNKNNTAGGFSEGSSFNGGSGTSRRPMGEQTMRPVTLKQIQNTVIQSDNLYKIDGADVTQVTFVAVVREVAVQATHIQYTMEDGTAMLDIRQWIDSNDTAQDTEKRSEISKDIYVRVHGRINSFNNKINTIAFSVRPITDFNEITYHYLDAILTHVNLTGAAGGDHGDRMQIDSGDGAPAAKNLTTRVLDAIKQYHDNEEGASVPQIVQQLQGVASEQEIRDVVEHLTNEGHCYATTDEDHVKSTESM